MDVGSRIRSAVPLRVAVLGSTGSIGASTLEVIAASDGEFVPFLLAAHRRTDLLLAQARAYLPQWIVVLDPAAALAMDRTGVPAETQVAVGPEALDELVQAPEIDRVVAASCGFRRLESHGLPPGKHVRRSTLDTDARGNLSH